MTPDQPISAPAADAPPQRRSWPLILLRICFAIFTFEVGVFLLVFPWLDGWELNFWLSYSPALENLWLQPAFKGALSGLGLINIFIAVRSVFQRRPAQ